MANHLLSCPHLATHKDAKEVLKIAAEARGNRNHRSAPIQTVSSTSAGLMDQYVRRPLSERQYKEFEEDVLKLTLLCSFSFNSMESAAMRDFLLKWVGGLKKTPTRHDLSVVVLPRVHGSVCSEANRVLSDGTYVSYQMDSYKTAAKTKLVGVLANTVNKTTGKALSDLRSTHDITGVSETADLVLGLLEKEIDDCVEAGLYARPGDASVPSASTLVAIVSDSASVNVAAKRRLQQKYPALIILACAAHQLNLIMGNIITHSKMKEASALCCVLVGFFTKSNLFMGLLHVIQDRVMGRRLEFIKKGDTRWFSHHGMVRRILDMKAALIEFSNVYFLHTGIKKTKKGPDVLKMLRSWEFWEMVEVLRSSLQPLVVELGLIEKRTAHLGNVVDMFGRLHAFYDNAAAAAATPPDGVVTLTTTLTVEISTNIIGYLQWRWSFYYDAGLLVPARILDPSRQMTGLRTAAGSFASPSNVLAMIVGLCARFGLSRRGDLSPLQQRAIVGRTMRAAHKYRQPGGSSDLMAAMTDGSEARRHIITAVELWALCSQHDDTVLPDVAQRLLSAPPHAAELERVWSLLGLTTTDLRTRISPDRLTKMAKIIGALRQQAGGSKPERRLYVAGSSMNNANECAAASIILHGKRLGDAGGGGSCQRMAGDGGDGAGTGDGLRATEDADSDEDEGLAAELLGVEEEVERELADEMAASGGPGGRSNDATTAADMEQEDMTASQMMAVFQELASPSGQAAGATQLTVETSAAGKSNVPTKRSVAIKDLIDHDWFLAEAKELYGSH